MSSTPWRDPLKRAWNFKDLTGQRFGKLITIRHLGRRPPKNGGPGGWTTWWECQCDCGNLKEAQSNHLLRGAVTNCGCFQGRPGVTDYSRVRSPIQEDRKYCTGCSQWKPLTEFHASNTGHGGLHSRCKGCASQQRRDYYRRDPDKDQEKNRDRRRGRRKYLTELKLSLGCIDCGFKDHAAALHFDHIDPATKLFNLSNATSFSWSVVIEELRKCVVRCANCHTIRTFKENHNQWRT